MIFFWTFSTRCNFRFYSLHFAVFKKELNFWICFFFNHIEIWLSLICLIIPIVYYILTLLVNVSSVLETEISKTKPLWTKLLQFLQLKLAWDNVFGDRQGLTLIQFQKFKPISKNVSQALLHKLSPTVLIA